MKNYKRFTSLMGVQWNYTKKLFFLLILCFIGAEGSLLYLNLRRTASNFTLEGQGFDTRFINGTTPWYYRFELLLSMSHWDKIFIIGLFLILILLTSNAFRQRSAAVVEYTYTRLPMKSNTLLGVMFLHNLSLFLILIGVQFAMVFVGYKLYVSFVIEDVVMKQGLFLAFIRWDFLRRLYPITDGIRLLFNVVCLVHISFMSAIQGMRTVFRERTAGLDLFVIVAWILLLSLMSDPSIPWFIYITFAIGLDGLRMFRKYQGMVRRWSEREFDEWDEFSYK